MVEIGCGAERSTLSHRSFNETERGEKGEAHGYGCGRQRVLAVFDIPSSEWGLRGNGRENLFRATRSGTALN